MSSPSTQLCGFRDPFDQRLAEEGPPAIFGLDADGELSLDLVRTREAWAEASGLVEHEPCHCLIRDNATGWVQYVLITSPSLCRHHPRADIVIMQDQQMALKALSDLGVPPVCVQPLKRVIVGGVVCT